jgi:hypothetical protein
VERKGEISIKGCWTISC